MSDLRPNAMPKINITMKYETKHLVEVVRGVSDYNRMRMEFGEAPLHPHHALIKLQHTIIRQLTPLIETGVREGFSVGDLLALKQEISDLMEEVLGDDVPE